MSTARHTGTWHEPPDSWLTLIRLVLTDKHAARNLVLVITLPLLAIVALVVVPVIFLGAAGLAGVIPVAGAAIGGKKYLDKRARRRR